MLRTIIVILALVVLAWAIVDLNKTRHADLRKFDPRLVSRLETDMWRSYYDRRPVALYRQMADLMRTQYGFSFLQSQIAAWHAARAAFVFKRGHNRGEYEQALPSLRRFYGMIRRDSNIPFDAGQAARLELEWWIIHRDRAQYGLDALKKSLAELQACLYLMPVERFADHAAARADAMVLRDEGGDWTRIGQMLDHSWTSLHDAVNQPASAASR